MEVVSRSLRSFAPSLPPFLPPFLPPSFPPSLLPSASALCLGRLVVHDLQQVQHTGGVAHLQKGGREGGREGRREGGREQAKVSNPNVKIATTSKIRTPSSFLPSFLLSLHSLSPSLPAHVPRCHTTTRASRSWGRGQCRPWRRRWRKGGRR